ncbi:BolA/IbaG family iron-sulfur metabolism protein [Crenobacter sp. SG2305]|uniref:BolA family protein n=1 Tax=Crenobacter oryzisoli TaxID=3056844 RepID=UPI0025AAE989|nr:BolA/IbaG family iron-sulfur metabolism protein [Crenobacter sp. SG2305]MDN0085015.1 BolA/IbaG family iron-sulfur metabolism protein [Crenobacter sp. SG2305]
MVTPELVQQYITAGLDCTHITVEGDGHHFYAQIVSPAFAGKRLIERHRIVMEVVKSRLQSNEIHALSIVKALTPDEWEKQQG